MKPDYTAYIDAILAGSPINVQAKLAGVNMNTLRRILIAHPDYEKAKAEGKLRPKGIPAKLRELAKNHPAVAEVVAGAKLQETAEKYQLPLASLHLMIKFEHPALSLLHRGATPQDIADAALKKAERALANAQRLAKKAQALQPTENTSTA